ncbi:MAG: YkvA family protein [Anaerolineales bacterium]
MNKNYVENLGWWEAILHRLRLAWYLLLDERVPIITKLTLALVVAYVLSPLDLIPDVLLGLGQLDDLAIFLLGLQLFINLSPPEIVAEVQRKLAPDAEGQVIDVEVINPYEES